jgi:NAD(P)-dependent dehydrogenase (short-subunit alcohol dehydrogenase family)
MNKKIALITGANKGIGLACVELFCQNDFHVILTSRNVDNGKDAFNDLKSKYPNLEYHQLDVNDEASISKLIEFITEKYGRLEVLINNAGINYDTWQNALNADLNNVKETLETNLFGAWRMCQTFIPLMKKNGYGRIINISSGAGSFGEEMKAGTPGYSISKTSLNVLTLKLSKDLEHTGVLVNSMCPGWVRTDMGGQDAPRSVDKGAETVLWLAELNDDGPNGLFFRDKDIIPF